MGIFSIFSKNNILYFPGCISYYKEKETFELWKRIFDRLGIDFRVPSKKVCCGNLSLELGYETEARKLARRNFEIFKEDKINTIITPCPECYKNFLYDYKNFLPDWNIEVKDIWQFILERLEEKPSLIKNRVKDTIGFQDSCYLGRYCNIYEAPRKILKLIGYDVQEFKDNRENAFCLGNCGGLTITNTELSDSIAKERLQQAKRLGIKKIVVCSISDYLILKKNSKDFNIEILDFSIILADSLQIKKRDIIIKDDSEISKSYSEGVLE